MFCVLPLGLHSVILWKKHYIAATAIAVVQMTTHSVLLGYTCPWSLLRGSMYSKIFKNYIIHSERVVYTFHWRDLPSTFGVWPQWSNTCPSVWSFLRCTPMTASTITEKWFLFPTRPRKPQHLGEIKELNRCICRYTYIMMKLIFEMMRTLNRFERKWMFIIHDTSVGSLNMMLHFRCPTFSVDSRKHRKLFRWRCITSDTRQRMTHGCPSTCWSARHCPRRRLTHDVEHVPSLILLHMLKVCWVLFTVASLI